VLTILRRSAGFGRRRAGIIAGATLLVAVGAGAAVLLTRPDPKAGRADPADATQIAQGRAVYAAQCAACHGTNLEGQPNWRQRQPNGRLPAPPHDASGHTWHHPDRVLFEITRDGIAAHAPAGYESDMPAFSQTLSDGEIWAVLAYIKSTWPADIRERQERMSQRASEP
jgi:mono/diheme cytochrome c family protein